MTIRLNFQPLEVKRGKEFLETGHPVGLTSLSELLLSHSTSFNTDRQFFFTMSF